MTQASLLVNEPKIKKYFEGKIEQIAEFDGI